LGPADCDKRIGLVDEYSRRITDYAVLRDALERQTGERKEQDRGAVEAALAESQKAWEALEQHIAEHQCLDLGWPSSDVAHAGASEILGQGAAAALDIILIVDDDRRFVDMNEAAADILGLPRNELVGRRVDDFFSLPLGEPIPAAWNSFISKGVQCGICEVRAAGPPRRFEYRAKANFAAGLHLSVLREHT
jgi:PAS domain-containing protein